MKYFLRTTLIVAVLAVPSAVRAVAQLYFSSPPAAVCAGAPFTLELLLDANEPVNAGEIDLSYNSGGMSVASLDSSGSVFRFWAEGPEYDNGAGTVHMVGGLPTPGFQGTGGRIVRLSISATGAGNPGLVFGVGTQILRDDGFGTQAALTTINPTFSVLPSTDPACAPPTPPPTPTPGPTGTPGPTPPPGTPGPTPTPLVCPETSCSIGGEDSRPCDIIITCESVPSRTIPAFVADSDATECPVVALCPEDLGLLGPEMLADTGVLDTAKKLLDRPFRTVAAFTRSPLTGPFFIGLCLGALAVLVVWAVREAIRRHRMRKKALLAKKKHIGEGSLQ